MSFKLPQHIHDRLETMRQAEYETRAAFAQLSDADLAISAKFWLQHCEKPKRVLPGTPVYDSTFWHAIVPEMIRRLQRRS
jgi:hypothetical protein